MKRIIIILLSLFAYNTINAETKFGLIAGVSNSTFLQKNVTTGSDYVVIKVPYSDYGIHAGGFFRLNIGIFAFQPELYLSSISNTYKISNPNPFAAVTNVYRNDRNFNLELPVLFGVKAGPVRFMAGPSGRLVLFNLNQLKDYTGYDMQFNRALWSIQTGIGIDIDRFQLNLKYEFGVSKIAKGIIVDGVNRTFDSRANQVLVSIGWAL
jgi:hypothetical protein